MTPAEQLAMTDQARAGTLTPEQQLQLSTEFLLYRDMAIRLERALHELIKEVEK